MRISRLAVLTVGDGHYTRFLCRKINQLGIQTLILRQRSFAYPPFSFRYYKRLAAKRGVLSCIDNMLLPVWWSRPYRWIFGQRGRVDGGYSTLPEFTWAAFSTENNIPVEEMQSREIDSINSVEGIQILTQFEPDLIILSSAPIVSRTVLEVSKLGILNPHCGITPQYAGNDPMVWALYENDPFSIGYTIHYAVPQVDSGPIIEQKRLPWRTCWTWGFLNNYVSHIMHERLITIIADWNKHGQLPSSHPQEVCFVRPPAGYFVWKRAEREKSRLFHDKKLDIVIPTLWNGEFQTETDFSVLFKA